MQIVVLLGEAGVGDARAHIDALAAQSASGVQVPPTAKYAVLDLGESTLVWERHTEFATYMLLRHGDDGVPPGNPFDPGIFEPTLSLIKQGLPGQIIRATQIAIVRSDDPDPVPDDLPRWFDDEATVVCDVGGGAARIASDFRLNPDGYGRLLVIDRDLRRDEPPQLLLRLQELGNYRNMALIGLPLAQTLTPTVTQLEGRLAELTHAVSERTSEDGVMFTELTFLADELARIVAETRYRMSATRAYAQLSLERLSLLKISPVRGYQTLADFTERRLLPAVRTCDSFSARLEDLSQRVSWTSELLRTRVDIALAQQNRDLLQSMDRRTRLQLRLQQTVEGLSVVAISYYLVSLIGHALGALPHVDHERVVAIAVPVVLIGVALMLRRLRHHLSE